jgi:hypothetical protein
MSFIFVSYFLNTQLALFHICPLISYLPVVDISSMHVHARYCCCIFILLTRNATTINSALNYIKNKQQEQQNKRLVLDSTSNDNNYDDDGQLTTTSGGRQLGQGTSNTARELKSEDSNEGSFVSGAASGFSH